MFSYCQHNPTYKTKSSEESAPTISLDMDFLRDLSVKWTLSNIDILTITPQQLHRAVLHRKSWTDVFLTTKQKQTLHYFRHYPCMQLHRPSAFVPSVADYFDLLDRLLINDSWYMPDRLTELIEGHTALGKNLKINRDETVAVDERAPHPDLWLLLERWDEQIKDNEEYLFMLKGLERRRYTGFDPVHIYDESWKKVPCL